jgi:acyl-coenzyme A synthetase/AMP-(fatty) acid ligase
VRRRDDRPRARLAALLADARPSLLLAADDADAAALEAALDAAEALASSADDDDAEKPFRGLVLTAASLALWQTAASPPPAPPRTAEAAVAYVCYTSGSSGAPKGVLGTSSWLLARCAWAAAAYPAARDDVAALRCPPAFVDAAAELLAPLLAGVTLAVLPGCVHDADPVSLASFCAEHRVTRLTLLPSLLAAALPALAAPSGVPSSPPPPSLRLLTCSGEPLPASLAAAVAAALPEARLLNVYGSTECGADATCFDLAAERWRPPHADVAGARGSQQFVPIGRCLPGVWAAVLSLDQGGAPVREAGAAGELLIGGACVAAGYLNAPELSAQRFPLVSRDLPGADEDDDGAAPPQQHTSRAHRTGDVAAWTPCGALALRGRIDAQVKLRGQRVDLTEVEAVLCAHPDVAAAAARLWAAAPEARMGAYVVLRSSAGASGAASEEHVMASLQTWLRERLLPVALPAALRALPALPRTAAGKVDRAALPEPTWAHHTDATAFEADADDDAGADDAHSSALLLRLRHAFGAALGLDGAALPRAHADFFAAGGTSLAAAALCGRLRVPLQALLDHPTPSSLARSGRVPHADVMTREEQAPAARRPRDGHDDAMETLALPPPPKRLRLPPDAAAAACISPDAADEAWAPAMALSFACRCDVLGDADEGASQASALPSPPLEAAADVSDALELACAWRVPLHACVDASPLLLLPRGMTGAAAAAPARWRAVIGSHAHAVLCVEFDAPPASFSAAAASAPAAAAAARVVWSTDVGCVCVPFPVCFCVLPFSALWLHLHH